MSYQKYLQDLLHNRYVQGDVEEVEGPLFIAA